MDYRKYRNSFIPSAIILNVICVFTSGYLSWITGALSTLFYIISCYYWAKYKGQPGWLAALGLIAFFGFIPLAFIKNKAAVQPTREPLQIIN